MNGSSLVTCQQPSLHAYNCILLAVGGDLRVKKHSWNSSSEIHMEVHSTAPALRHTDYIAHPPTCITHLAQLVTN